MLLRILRTLLLNLIDITTRFVSRRPVQSPYLEGNYAPVRHENDLSELQVVGSVPSDLRGVFVRNGPNPRFHPVVDYHWFDGDGMLHGAYLDGESGGVRYINRYVRTRKLEHELKLGKAYFYGIGGLSNLLRIIYGSMLGAVRKVSPLGNAEIMQQGTANTSVEYHSGRFMALVESSAPTQVDARDLTTVGVEVFGGKLTHPFTAHPKIDPVTKEMMFFGYMMMAPPYCRYSVANADGEIVRTIDIRIPQPVMMHDMAVTEHYSIILDLPLTFDKRRVAIGEPVFAFEERPARFGVLPRHAESDAEVRWFEAKPCFIFHTAGAYEVGDNEVVLLACRTNRTDMLAHRFRSEDDRPDYEPHMYEFRFDLRTGQTHERMVNSELVVEFPRIHPSLTGRRFRYAYCADIGGASRDYKDGPTIDGVAKFDFETGAVERYAHGAGRAGGECVFVPRANSTAEDDGYLMTFVFDAQRVASELVVLDAQRLSAGPLCRVLLPCRVPFGFHGLWMTQEQIDNQRLPGFDDVAAAAAAAASSRAAGAPLSGGAGRAAASTSAV